MYCSKCGSEVLSGEYCSKCGQRQNDYNENAVYQYEMQKRRTQQNEIILLDKIIKYFSPMRRQFKNYDEACEQVNRHAKPKGKGLFIAGVIMLIIGIILAVTIIKTFRYASTFITEEIAYAKIKTSLFTEILLDSVFFLIPGFTMLVCGVVRNSKNEKERLAWEETYITISQELYGYYLKYPNCPIEAKYCNPLILEKIKQVILSGYADTVQEVIDRFVSYIDSSFWEYIEETQKNVKEINQEYQIVVVFWPSKFFS